MENRKAYLYSFIQPSLCKLHLEALSHLLGKSYFRIHTNINKYCLIYSHKRIYLPKITNKSLGYHASQFA